MQKCNELEKATKEALDMLNMNDTIDHVTDFAKLQLAESSVLLHWLLMKRLYRMAKFLKQMKFKNTKEDKVGYICSHISFTV